MENLTEFDGQWNEIIPKLKQKFEKLTDDDLLLDDDHLLLEGKQHELLERLQQKLGKTKKEVCDLLHDLLKRKATYTPQPL